MNSLGSNNSRTRPPVAPEGRDERGDGDDACVNEEFGHLTDPSDVLDALGVRKPEVFVETITDVVPIEQVSVFSLSIEFLFDDVGDGRFARSGQGR